MQMVYQDPLASFDPKMKIIDILTEPLLNFGMLKKPDKAKKGERTFENGRFIRRISVPLSA